MTSKKFYIVVVVLIIIVASLVLIFNFNKTNISSVDDVQKQIDNCVKTNYKYTDCLTDLAIKYQNISICNYITSYMGVNGCLEAYYIVYGNASDCEQLRWGMNECKQAILNRT
jgi:hypothetical protein